MKLKTMLIASILSWLCFGVLVAQSEDAPLQLNKLSQIYLPYEYEDGHPQYCYGEGKPAASLYQPEDKLVYVVGESKWLQIVNITDVENPKLSFRQNINTGGTALARCEGMVVVTALNFWNPSGLGNLLVYTQYDPLEDEMTWKYNLTLGATPIDLAFTKDCSKLIIANQGFHGLDRGNFYNNPPGSISIVDFLPLADDLEPEKAQALVQQINLTQFDEVADELVSNGVRWVYRDEFTPDSIGEEFLSNDLEPTNLVMDEQAGVVYVFMKKNNAVALFDMNTNNVTQILPLGSKSFTKSAFDPSSVDGGVSLSAYPISGLYQPGMVVPINGTDGKMYLISVNTGMDTNMNREINGVFNPYQDWIKGTELAEVLEDLELLELLRDENKLGDLKFSVVDDGLVTFGGRSFSVWQVPDLEVVYDSGYILEQRHKTHLLSAYNSVPADPFCAADEEYEELAPTAEVLVDLIIEMNTEEFTRMEVLDDLEEMAFGPESELLYQEVTELLYTGPNALVKGPNDFQDVASNTVGPEPNTIAIGNINGTRIMVIGNRGPSTLFVFDVTDPTAPVWQSASHFGAMGETYYELYQTTSLGDIAPSSLTMIPESDSPNGEPLLLVTGEMSGTLSVYGFSRMEPPSWMARSAPVEDPELITPITFAPEPLNQTQEIEGRGKISDLTNGICQDVPPDSVFTCPQQASFGKCMEAFMVERNFCARTCKRLPCNQGGIVESVMTVQNASLLTVNSYMFPENVAENLEKGVLSGYQCVGRSDSEVCLQTPSFFSGLAGPIELEPALAYISISDRGPNQDCQVLQDSGVAAVSEEGKGFPVPDFSPFISKVSFDHVSSQVVVDQTCYLKGTDGSLVTGLSNTPNDDTPYSKDCQSPLDYNPSGVDSEDIYPIGETGLCLVVEEYSPSIFVINCDFTDMETCGSVIMRYTPKGVTLDGASYPVSDRLPEVYQERRKNRGFESIAVSPDGGIAYVFVQSPLGSSQEGSPYRDTTVIRVLELDIADPMDLQVVGEYLYIGDTPDMWTVKPNIAGDVKLSAALWLGDVDSDDLLVLERAKGQVKLYVVNFSNATNVFELEQSASLYWEDQLNKWEIGREVFPITKNLLLDSQQVEGWDGEIVTYKQEGVGLVNDCTVIFGADNDFGLGGIGASTATVVRMQQCISELTLSEA